MKRILLLTILELVFCFEAFGQGVDVKLQKGDDYKIDEYEKITWKDEKERLQKILLAELANRPTWKAYLIFSYRNNSKLKLIKLRQKKILKFFKDKKISTNRFQMIIARKGDFYETDIWIVPEGAELPN